MVGSNGRLNEEKRQRSALIPKEAKRGMGRRHHLRPNQRREMCALEAFDKFHQPISRLPNAYCKGPGDQAHCTERQAMLAGKAGLTCQACCHKQWHANYLPNHKENQWKHQGKIKTH